MCFGWRVVLLTDGRCCLSAHERVVDVSKGFGAAVVSPCSVCLVPAPTLTGSCTAIWSNATSISFTWPSASSAVGVTYNLTDTTTGSVLSSGDQTSAAIGGLASGMNYTFFLSPWTRGQSTTSQSISCSGWTGKQL